MTLQTPKDIKNIVEAAEPKSSATATLNQYEHTLTEKKTEHKEYKTIGAHGLEQEIELEHLVEKT